jgi:hypothetical protein
MMDQRPKLVAASQRLQEPIEQCDVIADMEAVRRRVTQTFFSLMHTVRLEQVKKSYQGRKN